MKRKVGIEMVLRLYGGEVPTRGGSEREMRCPFHPDENPSASVNVSKGLFYCHGCGTGGDIFTIVMQQRGCGFVEAKDWIVERLA